jgi:lactate dehydrogenase-like 2-hydroxyacid dehydrogenase
MKPDAYLINTSRAAIVDQEALLAVLHAGGIAGAGADVFDEEPLPAGHPMRTTPRLLATRTWAMCRETTPGPTTAMPSRTSRLSSPARRYATELTKVT